MKLLTVVGARPQFVKAAVLSRVIKTHPNIEEVLVHTGQHYDHNMSGVFFEELKIPKPKYTLGISGMSHGAMIGSMIMEIEKVLVIEKPTYVVVYGDTNSTLAAAISAKKLDIPVIHIEAGVRNFDEMMPEESNRYLVDRLSTLNFCCTELGVENLRAEGFFSGNIMSKVFNFGDLMLDAALHYEQFAVPKNDVLRGFNCIENNYAVCTVHRASNTDSYEKLKEIIGALNCINKDTKIVLLAHPRTAAMLINYGIKAEFKIFEPVSYLEIIPLIKNAKLVITDSGGLIREAFFFAKPSLLLLDNPLWPELVDTGCCENVAPVKDKIIDASMRIARTDFDFSSKVYGSGNAGELILDAIVQHDYPIV